MSEQQRPELPRPLSLTLVGDSSPEREDRLWAAVCARRGFGGHSEPPRPGFYVLRAPLSRALSEDDDIIAERSRLWRAIQALRRERRARSAWSGWAWRGGFATAALVALVVFALSQRDPGGPSAAANTGALIEASGAPVRAHAAGPAREIVRLSDASEIRLEPGAHFVPLLSSDSRFEVLLATGSAEFSVTPGGPRRWVIHAGLADVEVVGTVFRVERGEEHVRVTVSRGAVLVRGDGVPERAQRLAAGGSIEVRAAPIAGAGPNTASAPPADLTFDAPAADEPSISKTPSRAQRTRAETFKRKLARGEFANAYAALGPKGFDAAVARAHSVERLLSLADVARLSGHPSEATKPLERVLRDFAASPEAAVAAFTLGRVWLDQLHAPHQAAKAFEKAIALHPPHALLADCHARLVEAYREAGDLQGARRAAARYRTLFPAGRHLADVERWTSE